MADIARKLTQTAKHRHEPWLAFYGDFINSELLQTGANGLLALDWFNGNRTPLMGKYAKLSHICYRPVPENRAEYERLYHRYLDFSEQTVKRIHKKWR